MAAHDRHTHHHLEGSGNERRVFIAMVLTGCFMVAEVVGGPEKRRRALIFATSLDKDARAMLKYLLPQFDHVIFTRYQNNPRAVEYRKAHGIDHSLGTAVNIQAMVFGNLDVNSATGVLFTRDPSTGAPHMVGEWLQKAQGEDIVAGIRTPTPPYP